ncbi:hypothetical protein AB1286_27800 [Trinickia sp. NRRL B-1857]|uniref:hypothetical protein n=1 Tax=Trinickia sp. NRRL B-1857 TaxID=3162879 RepID=UPI003D2C65D3
MNERHFVTRDKINPMDVCNVDIYSVDVSAAARRSTEVVSMPKSGALPGMPVRAVIGLSRLNHAPQLALQ